MLKINNAPFSQLNLNRIYEFYDEPIIYTSSDELGRLYLTIWVDWDEEKYTWLTKQISHRIAKDLESKTNSLRDIVLDSRNPQLYITEEFNDSSKQYYISDVNDINPEFLPDEDSYLEVEFNETDYSIESVESSSRVSNRYTVDLSLEPNNSHEHEIGASVLGETLVNFQNLVNSMALEGEVTSKTRITKDVQNENELLVTDTFAASFGVRLESEKLASILQEDTIKNSLNNVLDLLSIGNDFTNANSHLSTYNLKSLTYLSNLLTVLDKREVGIKVKTAFPTTTDEVLINEVHLSSVESSVLLNGIMNKQRVTTTTLYIDGTLYSHDSKTGSFKLVDKESSIVYSGYVSQVLDYPTFKIPSDGVAELLVEETNNVYTGQTKAGYTLVSWQAENTD